MSRVFKKSEPTYERAFCLKTDKRAEAWGVEITLPKGARVVRISGLGGGYAIDDVALLVRLTGNSHDPHYRWLWVDAEDVEGVP